MLDKINKLENICVRLWSVGWKIGSKTTYWQWRQILRSCPRKVSWWLNSNTFCKVNNWFEYYLLLKDRREIAAQCQVLTIVIQHTGKQYDFENIYNKFMRSAVLKSGLFRLNARRTFSTCRVTISYTGGGGWSGPPYKKFANNFKDFLASEFDSSEVNVTLQQLIGQDAITSPHDFVMVLVKQQLNRLKWKG